MPNVFATADQHFGHANIIRFTNRPFKYTDEMREILIANHNKVVKVQDTVYHLGDLFWRTLTVEQAVSIRSRLNGNHYFIYGNHDELMERNYQLRSLFGWCKDTYNLKVSGYPNIFMSHYAHRVWNGSHKGAYHLYGHSHGELPEDGSLSFDVGVDAQNFTPISIEEIDAKMKVKAKCFLGKCFVCPDCANKFVPFHTRQTFCSKCGSEMELK
jgi:calcineurin-like phosphoesterase family protein